MDKQIDLKTISGLLISNLEPRVAEEVEAFRKDYEAVHGPTDLTLHYVTRLPADQQDWLLEHHPAHYWQGLPPFYREYLKQEISRHQRAGLLDDIPDAWLHALNSGAIR